MDKKYEPLFTPWKIGNCEIKNRIVMCPMGGTSLFGWMELTHFDKEAANLFLDIAKNNVGLIIPGIAPLRNTIGGRWIYKAKSPWKKLKEFMDEIHKTGAKVFIQLTAGFGRSFAITEPVKLLMKNKLIGFFGKPAINASYLTASPSELPSRWDDSIKCRALTVKEIEDMIHAFAETAYLCKKAGVDGVEVHAVHEGYVLDQFTLKYTNHRTDKYGGSFENRYRFPVEVVKAIKARCGKDYPVSLRYSAVSKTKGFGVGAMPDEDYVEVGRDLAESRIAAKYLQDAGYDMLNTDNGTYDAWYWSHPPIYMPKNCNLKEVEEIKKVVDIPVVCAGKMDPLTSAEAIKEGKIDAMGVARQFLTDHAWVTKLIEGKENEIMPCINCHNACFTMAHYKGVANDQAFSDVAHMSRCALNPTTMQSKKFKIVQAKRPKHVAIIGGGIGGMEAARVLSLRGHKVDLYEKTDHLGGVYVYASNFDFKEEDRRLINWYKLQLAEAKNVTIHFNTEIKDINKLDCDEVIVATGSKARKLRIKGIEKSIEAIDYLKGYEVGHTVAIIGGGLTGCEIAYDLYLKGHTPIIIEMKNDLIAVRGVCLANSSYLRDFFNLHKVEVHLESGVTEIGDGFIKIKDKEGKITEAKVDSVITSIGYKEAPAFESNGNVHIIGDAYHVGNLRTVIWRAWEVAMKI